MRKCVLRCATAAVAAPGAALTAAKAAAVVTTPTAAFDAALAAATRAVCTAGPSSHLRVVVH